MDLSWSPPAAYGHTAGAAITAHPDVEKVAFTGSTEVGKEIVRASAGNLKKVTLELGGKSPVLIFDDADMDKAILMASLGIFVHSGQGCVCGSRIFAQRGVYDHVVDRVEGWHCHDGCAGNVLRLTAATNSPAASLCRDSTTGQSEREREREREKEKLINDKEEATTTSNNKEAGKDDRLRPHRRSSLNNQGKSKATISSREEGRPLTAAPPGPQGLLHHTPGAGRGVTEAQGHTHTLPQEIFTNLPIFSYQTTTRTTEPPKAVL